MSILRRTLHLSACAALAAIAAFSQVPTNLYLLPNSSSTNPSVTAYRTDPFSTLNQFNVQPGASFLLMHPNGQKLYSVARSGSDTLLVLDAANPGTVTRRHSLGQAENAVLSPDGRRLLIVAGALHIIDTTSDTILATRNDVGNAPTDVAVALDASRAFVLSPFSNRLTAVDLNTNTVVGTPLPIPGQASGVAVGPNGYVYVSTVNLIQVIDGRSMTVVKEIQLNANPGKLTFTPDGQYALAVNRTPVTGSSVLRIALANHALDGTIPGFGVVLDRLIYAAANRIYATSNQTGSLYEVTLSPLNINPPQFGGFGDILPTINDVAVSGEIPNNRFLFLSTPGSILRVDLGSNPGLSSGAASAPQQPGPLVHLNAQNTGTATAVLAYNTAQTTTPGGTTLPLIARVTNSVGRPLFGVNVTFSTDNPNAQIQGALATTNTEGWAQTTVITPTAPGTFNVTASAGPGPNSPTATYVITTSTGSSGGGATGLLTIVRGQGQLVPERYLLAEPLTVQLRDTNGNPVAGQTITFAFTQGSGNLGTSTFDGTLIENTTCTANVCTSVTDAQGMARVGFLGDLVLGGIGYTQQTVSATNGEATVNFYVTTFGSGGIGGGTPVTPQIERTRPTELNTTIVAQAGTNVADAVQVKVVTIVGSPIPNVALTVRTENQDPNVGPVATCLGDGDVALTDASGVANCTLKVSGRLGLSSLNLSVGGLSRNPGGGRIELDVRPGPPAALRILQGNNQSGNPGQQLQSAFAAQVTDAAGNVLTGQSVNWEIVTPGSITLANVVSVSDATGRVSALGTLGNVAGQNIVRVRIGSLVQSFTFTTNISISQLIRINGDGQTTLPNQPFAGTMVVEVRDQRGSVVPGQPVQWAVVSGSASLSGTSVSTDANGRSTVVATAGATPGTVTIRASLGSLTPITFTLTIRPPGPVFSAAGIVTTARNQPGVSPCALTTIFGSNIAPGITGVVNTNYLGIGGLPLTYNNVEILMGGISSPILAIANQGGTESVVVQAPCELAPGRTSVVIRIPGAQTQVDNVQVFRAAPGIFETTPAAGQRAYAAIVRPDGSYVTPANPARRGEILMAAVTGLGQTTPPVVTNRVGLGTQSVTAPLVVGVNNQGVRIVSATYAPGMIGVYWVAFEIPLESSPGVFLNFAVAASEVEGGALIFGNGSTIAAVQ